MIFWYIPGGVLILVLLIDWIWKIKRHLRDRKDHRDYLRYINALSPELRKEYDETERLRASGEISPEESARRFDQIYYKSRGII